MTPTEQDKELDLFSEEALKIAEALRSKYPNTWEILYNNHAMPEVIAFITADRKRVALEAELRLLTYMLDERTEHMFMQNPDTGEINGNGWLCNTSLSAVSANRIEAERRKRIAELKAQQEEV